MNWVKFKAQSQLNKKCSAVKHTKIKGVPKLDDANDAGNVYHTFLFLFLFRRHEKVNYLPSSYTNHVLWQVGRTPLAAHWSLPREIQPRHLLCLGWEWSVGTAMASSLSEEKCSTSGRPHSSRLGPTAFCSMSLDGSCMVLQMHFCICGGCLRGVI